MAPKETGSPLFEIRVFGPVKVSVFGENITAKLSKRAALLLAILALRQGRPIERWRLAGMLWPESPDETALHNLRQTLSPLRHVLGPARDIVKTVSPRSMALDMAGVDIDVAEFDRACEQATPESWEQAVALYGEPLLSECDEPFAVSEREARSTAFLTAVDSLAHHYVCSGEFPSAINVLRRGLREDAYHEPACREMMTALAASGQPAAALDFCREFRHRLRKDLSSDVGPETRALYRSIRASSNKQAQSRTTVRRLPGLLPSLVGRQEEIAQVVAMLDRCRLVTLTGAGGVGKTRLALAVAERFGGDYMDGSLFVDLAPIRDAHMVARTVADVLEIREAPGQTISQTLYARLRDRELLIVIDNCEQVAASVAEFVEGVLSQAPGVRVLATSRQTIGVSGELVWRVPSLSLPPEHVKSDTFKQSDAVRLFLERCSEDSRQADNLPAIGSICRRLDGLPLAIELAAARTKVLSVSEIHSKLSDRFSLLAGGNHRMARHQTLRASIEWSWEMLPEDEKQVLMRLAVFRGGCTLQAAEAVAADLKLPSLLDTISSLSDRSLINVVRVKGKSRYVLLETIREFAWKQIEASGQLADTLDRHKKFFLEMTVVAYPAMSTPEETVWLEKFDADHDNLRSALDRCYETGDYDDGLRLAVGLCRFWDTCGHLAEGRRQVERALSYDTPGVPATFRGGAYTHAGWIATVQFDCHAAIAHYENALEILEPLGDFHQAGKALLCQGNAMVYAGDFSGAKAAYLKALEFAEKTNPGVKQPGILSNLAEMAFEQDDLEEARSYIEDALTEVPRIRKNSPEVCGLLLCCQAFLQFREGFFHAALDTAIDALNIFWEGSLHVDIPRAVEHVALAESGLGNLEKAATLFGAAENLVEQYGAPLNDFLNRSHDKAVAQIRAALGPVACDSHLQKGREMTIEECVRACFSSRQPLGMLA